MKSECSVSKDISEQRVRQMKGSEDDNKPFYSASAMWSNPCCPHTAARKTKPLVDPRFSPPEKAQKENQHLKESDPNIRQQYKNNKVKVGNPLHQHLSPMGLPIRGTHIRADVTGHPLT